MKRRMAITLDLCRRIIITRRKLSITTESVRVLNYYPGGMPMPGRGFSADSYRFGYNGKEKVNEIYGSGNFEDYGMRGLDNRLIRFWGVDPLTKQYPWYTPYQFAGNKFIKYVDLDGMEECSADLAMMRDEEGYLKGTITAKQLRDNQNARGVGALFGTALVLGGYAGFAEFAEGLTVESFKSAVTNYVASSTASAVVDAFAQSSINKFDFKKVDWFDVATNYIQIPGFGGKITKKATEILIKNFITSVVDYTQENGWQYVGGNGSNKKDLQGATVELVVGSVADGLFGKLNEGIEKQLEKSGMSKGGIEKFMTDITKRQKEEIETIVKYKSVDKSKEEVKNLNK